MSKFIKSLNSLFQQHWEREKETDGKLRFFFKYKKTFEYERYLDCVMKKHRTALTKLRLSSHKLPIEQMRYQNVASDKRLCTICEGGEVGDEIHFLTKCSNSKMIESRHKFFENARKIQPQLHSFNPQNIIEYCLILHDETLFNSFGNLVFDILENYENELEKVQEENTKCTIM